MIKRIIALSVIFACSWIGWLILTYVVTVRTHESDSAISGEVGLLWGTAQTQSAPEVKAVWRTTERREVVRSGGGWEYVKKPRKNAGEAPTGEETTPQKIEPKSVCVGGAVETTKISEEVLVTKVVRRREAVPKNKRVRKNRMEKGVEVNVWEHSCMLPLASTDVGVTLEVKHRKRGLLWFPTYEVKFDSVYAVENRFAHPVDVTISIPLPANDAVYDNMYLASENGETIDSKPEAGTMVGRFSLAGAAAQTFEFGYKSRGMDRWAYTFGNGVQYVENFNLNMLTNFDAVDFPIGSISPDRKEKRKDSDGWKLIWAKESVVSGLKVGMIMPEKLNPGPLAAAMNVHAPVSLFFFFFVIFIFQVLRDLKLHPMHYFFLATSFFAFNLLFSYMVGHVPIVASFVVSSAVSFFLVVTYMRRIVSLRFSLMVVAGGQLIYQVLFSLAHFFEGYTGLTVTIGAILTLGAVMRATAKVDWEAAFRAGKNPRPSLPVTEPEEAKL